MRVKSVYEYAGANETELSFSVGELIDVIDEVSHFVVLLLFSTNNG